MLQRLRSALVGVVPAAVPAVFMDDMDMVSMIDFWQEHRSRLRGYIAKRVGESDSVEDILQNVFLKALASLHSVKFHDNIPAWLFRIAANTVADYYRAQKPWAELPDELAAPEPERNHVAELARCVHPLMAALPETYRSALVLSELEGLPQNEVAKRLGISLSGAKSRVQRGRQKLRQHLLACCDIETGRNGIVGYEPRGKNCDGSACG